MLMAVVISRPKIHDRRDSLVIFVAISNNLQYDSPMGLIVTIVKFFGSLSYGFTKFISDFICPVVAKLVADNDNGDMDYRQLCVHAVDDTFIVARANVVG